MIAGVVACFATGLLFVHYYLAGRRERVYRITGLEYKPRYHKGAKKPYNAQILTKGMVLDDKEEAKRAVAYYSGQYPTRTIGYKTEYIERIR